MATVSVQSKNSSIYKFGHASNTNMYFYFVCTGTPNTSNRSINLTIELWVSYAYDYNFKFYKSQGSYIKVNDTNIMSSDIQYKGAGNFKLISYSKKLNYDSSGNCKVKFNAKLVSNGVTNFYDRDTLKLPYPQYIHNISMTLSDTVSLPNIGADYSAPSTANWSLTVTPKSVKPDGTISWSRGTLTGGQGNGAYKEYSTVISAIRGSTTYTLSTTSSASGSFSPIDMTANNYKARPGDTIKIQSTAYTKNASGNKTTAALSTETVSLYKDGEIYYRNAGTNYKIVAARMKLSSSSIQSIRYLKVKNGNSIRIVDLYTSQYD